MPVLVTVRTPAFADCQFVQVEVTSCEDPFENTPVAVVCAVCPAPLTAERFALSVTDSKRWRG